MRERWGTFSVRDHDTPAPFVTEVLLYDRLVIPVPPPGEEDTPFWRRNEVGLQRRCLDVLKVKTAASDGLALTVPWDTGKRERFRTKMSTAAALATQQQQPDQTYYLDPFEMTRELVKDEFRPALPEDVSHAWVVAAYGSAEVYRRACGPATSRRPLAAQVAHRFLTPTGSDPDQSLLHRAVDLSTSDRFRKARAALYQWQESAIETGLSDDKAIQELEARVAAYNKAVEKAFREVVSRYVYTVIPIGMALGGTLMTGALPAVMIAGAAGLVQVARFARFDRKPKVDAIGLEGAAMIHEARKVLFGRRSVAR